MEHAVLSWLARYLKRDTSVQTGPRFEWLADDAKWRSAADYPLTRRGLADGDHRPEDAADRADEPVRRADRRHAGGQRRRGGAAGRERQRAHRRRADAEAHLQRHRRCRGQTHVYAQIVDGSGHVVGNQATPIPVTLDGLTHTIERPLEAIASEAVAGSSYRLQITPATTLYTPQRSAGAVTFARIEVSLPIVGLGTKTSSGRAAETSAFGASTSSDTRSSAATLIRT